MSHLSDNSDKLLFYELHNNEVQLLRKHLAKQINSKVYNKDGFEFARILGSIDFEDKKFIKWLSKYN